MSVYLQTNQTVQLLNADQTIFAADTGKIMLIPALTVATRVINLPVVAAGLHYRFMSAPGAGNTLTRIARLTPSGGATINGALINNNGGDATVVSLLAAAQADLTGTSRPGDYIDIYCDGITWHVSGMSGAAAGLA